MANLLEQEAERLKAKYPRLYRPTIEHNLEWVNEEMTSQGGERFHKRGSDCNDHRPSISHRHTHQAATRQERRYEEDEQEITTAEI